MENFGERVKKRRMQLRLTQDELANRMGYVSKSSIGKIENSNNAIPLSKVQKIADALQTTPSYLMGCTDDPLTADAVIQKIQSDHDRLCSDLIALGYSEVDAETVYKFLKLTETDKVVVSSLVDRFFMSFKE